MKISLLFFLITISFFSCKKATDYYVNYGFQNNSSAEITLRYNSLFGSRSFTIPVGNVKVAFTDAGIENPETFGDSLVPFFSYIDAIKGTDTSKTNFLKKKEWVFTTVDSKNHNYILSVQDSDF